MALGRTAKGIAEFEKIAANIDKEYAQIKGQSMKGLIFMAVNTRKSMAKVSPKVPVDTSNLDHSFFIVTSNGSIKTGASPSFKGKGAGETSSAHQQALQKATQEAAQHGGLTKNAVALGFGAEYAMYVHENVGANFQKEGSGAKFFEAAIKREKKANFEILRATSRIK